MYGVKKMNYYPTNIIINGTELYAIRRGVPLPMYVVHIAQYGNFQVVGGSMAMLAPNKDGDMVVGAGVFCEGRLVAAYNPEIHHVLVPVPNLFPESPVIPSGARCAQFGKKIYAYNGSAVYNIYGYAVYLPPVGKEILAVFPPIMIIGKRLGRILLIDGFYVVREFSA
jgi:hypothetical protein